MNVFRRLMRLWLVMISIVFTGIMCLWWIDSAVAIRVLYFLNEIVTEYEWAFLLWRGLIYTGLFFGWSAIGRYMRSRTEQQWSAQSIQAFEHYRWRLLIILLVIELVVIQQVPFNVPGAFR